MQQAQQNFNFVIGVAFFAFFGLSNLAAVQAGTITHGGAPDPLLSDGRPGPCDPRPDQPGYIGGVDVAGNPVVPANVPSVRNPVPAEILVPLEGRNRHGRQGPVAALDGQTLDPFLNPPQACPPRPR